MKLLMPGAVLYREHMGNVEEKYVIDKITKTTATATDGTRFNRDIEWGGNVVIWGGKGGSIWSQSHGTRYLVATPEREQAYQHYKARMTFQNIVQGKPAKEITISQFERMTEILQEPNNAN